MTGNNTRAVTQTGTPDTKQIDTKQIDTKQIDSAHDLIALLAEHARKGVNVCPQIEDVTATVPDEFIPDAHLPVWLKLKEMARDGKPPTIVALRRNLPMVDPNYWVNLKSEESSIKDVRDAVLQQAQQRRYIRLHGELKQWIIEGKPFPEINNELANVIDESLAGAPEPTAISSTDYLSRVEQIRAGSIPVIESPWPKLNEFLAGGFYMGGDLAMTAVLAYSSVGKTRWAQQVNIKASKDGHWVLVFAGESNAEAYALGLAQLISAVPKSHMSPKTMTDDDVRRLRDAQSVIKNMNTHVYDKRFDVNLIRAVMSRLGRELKEARTAGRAPKHAQLLVIVDNIDHAIQGGGDKEWQELEQTAKALYNTAQRLNSHIIVLSQAKMRGFHEGHPPGLTDFARANLIASHCANIIGLYRPVTYEQQAAKDRRDERGSPDVRGVPKMSVAKSRAPGGRADTFECYSDDDIGAWS